MIDVNSSESLRAKEVEAVLAAIDDGLRARPPSGRKYLGASAIGVECDRRVQLDYIRANDLPGAPQNESKIEPKTQRVFDMGHVFEELAVKWLREAGFTLKTHSASGGQIGFSVAGGRFGGHCDGVFLAGPDCIAYPALFEHKALNGKSWREIAKHGLKKSRPVYFVQIMLYQAYLDLTNPAVFMALNKETAEIYCELVAFDPAEAQRASDRAVRIIQSTDAGELLPKAAAEADNFICKFCPWHSYCWADQP